MKKIRDEHQKNKGNSSQEKEVIPTFININEHFEQRKIKKEEKDNESDIKKCTKKVGKT